MRDSIVSGAEGLRKESFVQVSVYTPLVICALKAQTLVTAGEPLAAVIYTLAGAVMTLTLVACLALCTVVTRKVAATAPSSSRS